MSQNLSSAAVVNGGKRVNTDLLMLYPYLSCFFIVALMTMVMKNSADAQPDQNYGATLFIKVSIMVLSSFKQFLLSLAPVNTKTSF